MNRNMNPLGPALAPEGDLPKELEITDDLYLEPADPREPVKTATTAEVVERAYGQIKDNLLGAPTPGAALQVVRGYLLLGRVVKWYLGQREGQVAPPHPPNADKTLLPAVDAMLKATGYIQQEMPALLRGINVGEMRQLRQRVETVHVLRDGLEVDLEGVAGLAASMEQGLDAPLRLMMTKGEAMLKGNPYLQKLLQALFVHVQGAAEEGQKTKHVVNKAKVETKKETLEQVKEALEQDAAAEAAQGEQKGKKAGPKLSKLLTDQPAARTKKPRSED